MNSSIIQSMNLLDKGVENKVFPGAVACIGDKNGIIYKKCVGNRELYPDKRNMEIDTLFDMASLTKVVATTPLAMLLLQQGKLSIYDLVSDYLEDFKYDEELRVINLLTHTSGFEPFSALYDNCSDYDEAIKYIAGTKRDFKIGEKVLYSDYNYILIKAIIEKITNEPMDISCKKYLFEPLNMRNTCFNPEYSDNIASTEFDKASGKYLKGIVHDENARYFGGVSGHAGLFSTLEDLSKYCSMYLNDGRLPGGEVLLNKCTIDCMTHNYTENLGEGRGLGFCVKGYEKCSGGDLLTPQAFGHTGFTGTSLWIDKNYGIYIILLTNRVHPDRSNNDIIRFRRIFHNAVVASIIK